MGRKGRASGDHERPPATTEVAPSTSTSGKMSPASTDQQQPQQQQESKAAPNVASALSGALSGMAIGLLLQPLDVVGTRMKGDSIQGQARGIFSTAASIIRQRGPLGLWQGSAPSVIRMGLGVGLHMVLVDNLTRLLSQRLDSGAMHLSSLNALLAGGIPRAIASVLMNPIQVVKTRMEYTGSQAVRYKDTFDALATIARTEGARGLLRGLVPTILTNAPHSGLYYMFYTRLKELLAAPDRPQVLVNLSSGLIASVASTLVTQPFDVIRTRAQLSTQGSLGSASSALGLSVLKVALQNQGPASLFVGTLPRVLKRTAQTALVWTLYEELVPAMTAAYVGLAAAVASHSKEHR